MTDNVLFMTGASVFSLMIIGVVLTIVEFRRLAKRDERLRQARKKQSSTD